MREYDERDDEYDDRDRDRVPFPITAKIAGIIWMVFGTIGLIGQVVSMGMNAGNGNPASPICGFLIAITFLVIGFQTLRGTAKTTLGNGVGSIVFAVLYFGIAAVFFFGLFGLAAAGNNGGQVQAMQEVAVVVALILCAFGVLLLVAGVMAVIGNTDYRAWRVSEGLAKPKSRPKRRDDDEDDDERR